jgi:hypothetical protein
MWGSVKVNKRWETKIHSANMVRMKVLKILMWGSVEDPKDYVQMVERAGPQLAEHFQSCTGGYMMNEMPT